MKNEIFLSDKNYEFGIFEGIGINNTPWKTYKVFTIPSSNAYKYCISIEFDKNKPDFNGEPVEYEIYSVKVNYLGYNTNTENQTVTEYIETLKQSVEFCEKIKEWFKINKNLNIPFVNK